MKNNFLNKILIFSIVLFIVFVNPLRVYNNERVYEQTFANSTESFSKDSESYVIGSLVEAKQFGFKSGLGRLSRVIDPNATDWFYNVQITYKSYIENEFFEYYDFEKYNSQLGAQGILFRIMDIILYPVFGGKTSLLIMQGFNALMLSVVISIIAYYFYIRFGIYSLILFIIGIFYNQWILLASKNMYWIIWSMYLPMAISCIYALNKKHKILFLISLFLAIIFKSASGYEYISTVLVAMMIPLLNEEIINYKKPIIFLKNLLIPSLIGIAGFFTTIYLHFLRYRLRGWGVKEALHELEIIIVKRTHGSLEAMGLYYEALEKALEEPISVVLSKYFKASSINIYINNDYLDIKIWQVILIIVIGITFGLFVYFKKKQDIKIISAIIITVVSFLAPISWFILAKAHSAAHTFLNVFLWYLPFIPVGLSGIGYFLKVYIGELKCNITTKS